MRNYYAFRFGGRARGEDNLQNICGLYLKRPKRLARMPRDYGLQVRGIDSLDFAGWWLRGFRILSGIIWSDIILCKNVSSLPRTEHQPGRYLFADSTREIWGGLIVDGNRDHPAQSATKKCGNPFRRIRTPQQYGFTALDSSLSQLTGKPVSQICNSAVAPTLMAVSFRKYIREIVAPAFEFVQQVEHSSHSCDGGIFLACRLSSTLTLMRMSVEASLTGSK
jgi:hypothetical protein